MRIRSSNTRQRIFDAAARLFADQRFHEVRMEDIATEAEVGKGTLYRYFHDKEDLYFALISTASKELLGEVETRVARAVEPQAKLEEIISAIISFFDDHPYFFDLIQHVEALQPPARKFPWARTRKEFLSRVSELLQEGSARGAFAVHNPAICALMLLGATRAVIRFGKQPRPPGMAREIVGTFLYGATANHPGRTAPKRTRRIGTHPVMNNGRHQR